MQSCDHSDEFMFSNNHDEAYHAHYVTKWVVIITLTSVVYVSRYSYWATSGSVGLKSYRILSE